MKIITPKGLVKKSGIGPDEVLRTLQDIISKKEKSDLREINITDVTCELSYEDKDKIVFMKKIIYVPIGYEAEQKFHNTKITAEERDKQDYIGLLTKKLRNGKGFGGAAAGRQVLYKAEYSPSKNIETLLKDFDGLIELKKGLIIGDTLVEYHAYGD